MKQILVYSDSLSWGIIPESRRRLAFNQRWPGAFENNLKSLGVDCRVVEDCINGRRTVWDDPFKPGRNGLIGVGQAIEAHSPLALVVLMLGTNDFQSMHANDAWHSSQGIYALISAIRNAPIEPGMEIPPILVVAPPAVREPKGIIANKFLGADVKYKGLPQLYKSVAEANGCYFFDSNTVITSSNVDGVHIDAPEHAILAEKLADFVKPILL